MLTEFPRPRCLIEIFCQYSSVRKSPSRPFSSVLSFHLSRLNSGILRNASNSPLWHDSVSYSHSPSAGPVEIKRHHYREG
jgi:hypothetical protein